MQPSHNLFNRGTKTFEGVLAVINYQKRKIVPSVQISTEIKPAASLKKTYDLMDRTIFKITPQFAPTTKKQAVTYCYTIRYSFNP